MSVAEQSLDPAVVVLDDAVLRDIRDELGVAGVGDSAAFVVVELCDRGLQAAIVETATGVRLVERGDARLSPRMLDLAVADHLIRTARVQRPESADWAVELIDLTTELRTRLAVADGAFAMGADHIGLVRVSRRDLVAALRPHLLAAAELWQEAVRNAELPVGAIVFMPDHLKWPGLFATLSQMTSVPAVSLGDPGVAVAGRSRHGVSEDDVVDLLLPDDGAPQPLTPGPIEVPLVVVAAETVPEKSEADPGATPETDPEQSETDPDESETAAVVGEPEVDDDPVADQPQDVDALDVDAPEVEAPELGEPVADEANVTASDTVDEPPVATPVTTDVTVVRDPEPAVAPASLPVPSPLPLPVVATAPVVVPVPVVAHVVPPVAPVPSPPVAVDARNGTRFHSTHEQDVYFGSFAERGPISVNDHRDVNQTGGPRHYSPPVSPVGPSSPEARRVHNRRLLLGAAAVASSAAVGVVVLTLPWIEGDSSVDGQVTAAQTSERPTSSAPTQAPEPTRPPIDTGAARAPASQYVPAPSPTAQQQGPAAAPPRRTTPPRPRPRPRSIPNPIPGLPPILLP